jgi:hypothetical protein
MRFERAYFKKQQFTAKQIEGFLDSAQHDLDIACHDNYLEVRFTFSYQALLKAAIALIAKIGNVKVRSVPGHHVRLLEKMSDILNDKDIVTIGDAMRIKRNRDLYGGTDHILGEKEVAEYIEFVKNVIGRVRRTIKEG